MIEKNSAIDFTKFLQPVFEPDFLISRVTTIQVVPTLDILICKKIKKGMNLIRRSLPYCKIHSTYILRFLTTFRQRTKLVGSWVHYPKEKNYSPLCSVKTASSARTKHGCPRLFQNRAQHLRQSMIISVNSSRRPYLRLKLAYSSFQSLVSFN